MKPVHSDNDPNEAGLDENDITGDDLDGDLDLSCDDPICIHTRS